MKNHLAYTGVDKAYLDGEVTGDKLKDRKYNYLTYPDETDNYFQPHYELVYNFQPGKIFYYRIHSVTSEATDTSILRIRYFTDMTLIISE